MGDFVENIIANYTTMHSKDAPFEHLEPIPAKYGYTGVLLSVFFFQILNKIVSGYGPPKSMQTDVWKWKNLFVSWIHAIICGIWDLLCLYKFPEMFQDLVSHHTVCSYAMVSFSTGYFIYDFIDIILNNKLTKMWEILAHHIAVASIFWYNLVYCQCIAYNVVALLAEVNSIFLHSRKLLQMCQVHFQHWIYRINSFINMVTFVLCRFGGLLAIGYGMLYMSHRVSPFYYYILCLSMFVMPGINVILFWRLLRSDYLRGSSKDGKHSDSNGYTNLVHSMNNNVDKPIGLSNGFHRSISDKKLD